MRIVVTGGGGQVGRELARAKWPKGSIVTILDRSDLDISDPAHIEAALRPPVALVVNAAAYTAVDLAESNEQTAFRINAEGPALLAERCRSLGASLVQISTDYVFDGEKQEPYLEDDAPSPLSVYGRSKLEGEDAVRRRLDDHVILRTASVFSRHGTNFVKTMIRLGRERDSLSIVSDQISCPTPAAAIAGAITRIAEVLLENSESEVFGTYHFCGSPPTSWFRFAEEIFRISRGFGGPAPGLLAIDAASFAAPARRPPYSVLDCARIDEVFGISQPAWRDGLVDVIQSRLEEVPAT